jgi:hypothetical protein
MFAGYGETAFGSCSEPVDDPRGWMSRQEAVLLSLKVG